MQPDRHLISILGLCIVIIGIWSGVEIQKKLNQSRESAYQAEQLALRQQTETLATDPSFYLDENASQTPSQTQTAAVADINMPSIPVPTVPLVPVMTARAYLAGNGKTGKIYVESNANTVLPVASMSKLVTAFVATDLFATSTVFEVTEEMTTLPPDTSNLRAGEQFTLEEILKPLLLSSSNVAAEAIASSSNRKDFLESMSSYAWEIGMPRSYFADPSGLSSSNAATARDIFGLAQYLINYRSDILALTRVPRFWMATSTDHGSHQINSTHPFVNDARFIGGKTGRTVQAGETMLTILNISGEPLVLIVMGSSYGSRESDTRLLLEQAQRKMKE